MTRLHRRHWLAGALALPLVALLPACGKTPKRATLVPAGATVLALGDSLTAGVGAPPEAAYPTVLAARTGWQVVNGGVSGDTSAQALARLPALLADHPPALVIVSIGGNDFLRRLPEADTRAHVQRICELARQAGAQVLLVAVPRPSLMAAAGGPLTDHPLYADIARTLDLPLHREGWAEVLGDERLRSDTVHANAEGYAQFARSLAGTAHAVGLWGG